MQVAWQAFATPSFGGDVLDVWSKEAIRKVDKVSGLYNMVFGYHPHAGVALAMLDQPPTDFGRFRDAWLERNAEGVPEIRVYTRNGGGNRDECMPDFSEHPHYLRDEDDDYDSTYASIYFSVPEGYAKEVDEALPKEATHVDMRERWNEALANIGKPG